MISREKIKLLSFPQQENFRTTRIVLNVYSVGSS